LVEPGILAYPDENDEAAEILLPDIDVIVVVVVVVGTKVDIVEVASEEDFVGFVAALSVVLETDGVG
jgi:hypothetical protein